MDVDKNTAMSKCCLPVEKDFVMGDSMAHKLRETLLLLADYYQKESYCD